MSNADEEQPDVGGGQPPAETPLVQMVARTGPPWETTGPAGPRFIETAKAVLLMPTAMFKTMRRDGGFGPPLSFGVLGSTIGFAIGMLIQLGFSLLTPGTSAAKRPEIGIAVLMFLLFFPILVGINLLFQAAVNHFILWLLKAARQPFQTTARVICYTYGATNLLQIFPFGGFILVLLYSPIVSIIGLKQAHEISGAKAAAAILIPWFLSLLALGAVLAMAFAAMGSHGTLGGALHAV